MKKIPTIFVRNQQKRSEVLPQVNMECLWVFEGQGVATRKYDGTCVKIEDGAYFKRREVKKGKKAPSGFIEEMHDKNTGKRVGWIPVLDVAENKYHLQAVAAIASLRTSCPDGTYELVGPNIQGNPENYAIHMLIKHSEAFVYDNVPRYYQGLADWLKDKDIEGLVFHHPDGRMAKIKKRDFGFQR